MARLKGLLLWSADQEATGFGELLAEAPELVQAALGEAGELPPGLPPFDQVVILADWARVARDPAIVDQWRRTLGAAAVAVKSGLAKYIWKILLVAGAGSLAFLRKVFKRDTA